MLPVPAQMLPAEPRTTAAILVVLGLLLGVSALFSRASSRFGVPVFLAFLGLGMLAGSEGIGGIAFENYGLAFRLGTVALALILFDGGLNTPLASLWRGLAPAGALATVGVAGTMALVACGARFLGFPWPQAFLLGAVVSSTDAAAVFSVLRGSGLQLKERVGTTLELESGLNDPMAVILTTSLAGSLADGRPVGLGTALGGRRAARGGGGVRHRGGLRRPRPAALEPAAGGGPLPGAQPGGGLPRLRRADAVRGQRLPRRLPRRGACWATAASPTGRGSGASTTPRPGAPRSACS